MQRSWQTADEGCRFTSIKRKKPNCDNSLNVSGFRSLKGKTGHKNNGGITMIASIKKPKHSYKQPTEEDRRRHAAVLQKVQLRRSSTAAVARNDQVKKEQGMAVILNRVSAKRGSGGRINTDVVTVTKKFSTFEEAVAFFRTEQKMTSGTAIRHVVGKYENLHDDYVQRLKYGASMPFLQEEQS
jgi:hypothetical protein